jgi:hypothetical protein
VVLRAPPLAHDGLVGALAAGAGPQPEHVPLAVAVDAEHHVDGPVSDLPVSSGGGSPRATAGPGPGARRHIPDTVLIVDGTLVPAHDRSVAASSRN